MRNYRSFLNESYGSYTHDILDSDEFHEMMLSTFKSFDCRELKECVNRLDESDRLNEEVVAMTILSVLMTAPKVLSYVGKLVKFISKRVFKSEKNKAIDYAEWFKANADKLEKKYVGIIAKILKISGVTKSLGYKSDEEVQRTAQIILYIVAGVVGYSGFSMTLDAVTSLMNSTILKTQLGAILYANVKTLASEKRGKILDTLKKGISFVSSQT